MSVIIAGMGVDLPKAVENLHHKNKQKHANLQTLKETLTLLQPLGPQVISSNLCSVVSNQTFCIIFVVLSLWIEGQRIILNKFRR